MYSLMLGVPVIRMVTRWVGDIVSLINGRWYELRVVKITNIYTQSAVTTFIKAQTTYSWLRWQLSL
jgi:hypothetical protein